jgi:hypothetical protein
MINSFTHVETKHMLDLTILKIVHDVKQLNHLLNNDDPQKTQ